MIQKKGWKAPFALILLIVLLGGYYEKLGVEARTMVLPLIIFIAAGIVIARLKKLEYEISDEKDISRVTLDLLNTEPILKLAGNKGSVSIEFDEEGLPNLMLKDNMDKNIWSAR